MCANPKLFVMEGYRLIITSDEVFIPLFGLPANELSDLIKELEFVLKRRHEIIRRIREEEDAEPTAKTGGAKTKIHQVRRGFAFLSW